MKLNGLNLDELEAAARQRLSAMLTIYPDVVLDLIARLRAAEAVVAEARYVEWADDLQTFIAAYDALGERP